MSGHSSMCPDDIYGADRSYYKAPFGLCTPCIHTWILGSLSCVFDWLGFQALIRVGLRILVVSIRACG